MKIQLPMTESYVAHWGLWEAAREILQNAIDAGDYTVEYTNNTMSIANKNSTLAKESLMLGATTKADDEDLIGAYGEGYKLALLVLCRLGKNVRVHTGNELWTVSMERHDVLAADCLTINICTVNHSADTTFTIDGIDEDEYAEIGNNFYRPSTVVVSSDRGTIFEGPSSWKGVRKVFVSGLYVCDLDNSQDYRYSYNLAPSEISLDRDRSSVSNWSVQYTATQILVEADCTELLTELASTNAADVSDSYESITNYSSNSEGVTQEVRTRALQEFTTKYGDLAYPISKDYPVAKQAFYSAAAVNAGFTPIAVSRAFFDMLPDNFIDAMVKRVEVSSARLSDLLHQCITRHKKHMRSRAYKELTNLANQALLRGL